MLAVNQEELKVEDEVYDPGSNNDIFQIDEYDLTSVPNDFNVTTINNFIESGSIIIPGFQRNYVWDIKSASRLIESLILGLPVPQIFLYEEKRNNFLVIDGQQRLMSIYYFIKNRFPRKEKRAEIRRIYSIKNNLPNEILHDDKYFQNFKLNLSTVQEEKQSKFNGLNYNTLGDYKQQFELRPLRNVIVKQNMPKDDDSSIYEIFNRLNSGGMNLTAQEIRGCLYDSNFYTMLNRINTNIEWRRLLRMPDLDIHMKDIELLLRAFAMLIDGTNYTPSMAKFLNQFSKQAKKFSSEYVLYLEQLFNSFLSSAVDLPDDIFIKKINGRFNLFLFESVFRASCFNKLNNKEFLSRKIDQKSISTLESDSKFSDASLRGTTNKQNVKDRLTQGEHHIKFVS